MSRRSEILSAVCLFLAITATAYAQQLPSSTPGGWGTEMSNVPVHGSAGGTRVAVSVFGDDTTRLDRQAVVKLYDENIKHATWQPTAKNSETSFDGLGVGKYDVEVSAVGYLTARKEIEVVNTPRQPGQIQVKVVLIPDPDAVELNAAGAPLPGKASKETNRAIADLKSGKLKDAQKQLNAAYKIVPDNPHVNFLLGYLSFQQKNFDQAQTYLSKATTLDPHNIQALNLLGRRRYYRRHSFDHYMLFSVDSSDKVREATGKAHGPGSISPTKSKKWHA